MFCTDAASARPEACRDKSKGPRSGDFAGRSPGVQGAAATGRPLCAPCAIRDITQKINRERNLPGINIEVVALPNVVVLPNIVRTGTFPVVPLFRRVAATPCPAYRVLLQAQTSQARAGAAPPGKISGTVPVISPGGGCRLARPTGSSYRLIPRRLAQAQRPPGKISGTVPVISPGGGCRLTRPTGSSHRLIPRRPAQAQRRRA